MYADTNNNQILSKWFEQYVFNNGSARLGDENIPLLFDHPDGLLVNTHKTGVKKVLSRSAAVENMLQRVVSEVRDDKLSCGLIYMMFWTDPDNNTLTNSEVIKPLYFGISERLNKKLTGISANIKPQTLTDNMSINGPFARWGYNEYYHIGDLSRSLFCSEGKYLHWVQTIFDQQIPPRLKRSVYLWASSWQSEQDISPLGNKCHLTDLEPELIMLAKQNFEGNLNKRTTSQHQGCRCEVYKQQSESSTNLGHDNYVNDKPPLFIIPCSNSKTEGGDQAPWGDVLRDSSKSSFQFLNNNRSALVEHYASLQIDEASEFYRGNRGKPPGKQRKIENAYKKNMGIIKAPTKAAIQRYCGLLYSELNNVIKKDILNCSIDNVWILSALFGLIKPTDLIPEYQLKMDDISNDKKRLYKYWNSTFQDSGIKKLLIDELDKYSRVYCFMGEQYFSAIRDILPRSTSYWVKCPGGGTRSDASRGRFLNNVLMNKEYDHKKIEILAQNYGCVVSPLKEESVHIQVLSSANLNNEVDSSLIMKVGKKMRSMYDPLYDENNGHFNQWIDVERASQICSRDVSGLFRGSNGANRKRIKERAEEMGLSFEWSSGTSEIKISRLVSCSVQNNRPTPPNSTTSPTHRPSPSQDSIEKSTKTNKDRLIELKEMLEERCITQEDFDKKKDEILRDL